MNELGVNLETKIKYNLDKTTRDFKKIVENYISTFGYSIYARLTIVLRKQLFDDMKDDDE